MKKILATILTTFTTTALADKNINLSYSSNNNGVFDFTQTNTSIRGNLMSHKTIDFGLWLDIAKYNHTTLKIDKTVYGVSAQQHQNNVFWYVNLGLLKSAWNPNIVGSSIAQQTINGNVVGFGIAKPYKLLNHSFKPEFTYSRNTYYADNSDFTGLVQQQYQFGYSIYTALNPNVELGTGIYLRREQNTLIQAIKTVKSVYYNKDSTTWGGKLHSYITLNFDNGVQMTTGLKYFITKANSNNKIGSVKTYYLNLGYNL